MMMEKKMIKKIKLKNNTEETPASFFGIKEFPFNILTNSARTAFLNCRMKFYWQYICRLTPIKASLPFLIGGNFHDGLETFYNGEFEEDTFREKVRKSIESAMEAAETDKESEMLWSQEAVIMGMLKGYIERYAKQDSVQWDIIAPETDFVFDLKSGMKYAGKRDLLVRARKVKGITLVEHKTTSVLSSGYLAKLPLDNQILIYCKSVEEDKQFGELPKQIIYNVIKKSGLRQRQNETFNQYKERIEQEYLDNISSYFYREVIPVSPKVVRDAYEELERCSQEVQRCMRTGYYYKNTTHCTAYGTCPYMPLCLKEKSAIGRFEQRENLHAELNIEEDK